MRVSAVVRFDNLTRRYQITFIEDGRVEEVRTTDDEARALQWLTEFHGRRLSSHRLVEDGGVPRQREGPDPPAHARLGVAVDPGPYSAA